MVLVGIMGIAVLRSAVASRGSREKAKRVAGRGLLAKLDPLNPSGMKRLRVLICVVFAIYGLLVFVDGIRDSLPK
jgi:hypothetical protein